MKTLTIEKLKKKSVGFMKYPNVEFYVKQIVSHQEDLLSFKSIE